VIRLSASKPALSTGILLAGFAVAVGMRVTVGGPGVAQSVPAGLVFAAILTTLGAAAGTTLVITRRASAIGLLGGLALCVPALIAWAVRGTHTVSAHGFAGWAVVVTVVAVAEEYFLRGALFDASQAWLGEAAAVIITAAAFAALHIPLYGWHVVPLDLAVGLWLGSLRLISRTWTAPAVAHTIADLFAWWLR
jgi:membrane protease YdiL (CAAX protease family)